MADGDLILTLRFESASSPAPIPPPLGSCGAELYAAVAPLAHEDEQHGWPLAHLCEAIGRMRQAVSDLVRDSDDGPGWSAAVDVDRALGADREIDLLPWLGQLVGVSGIEHLPDADRRSAIREREGHWRGRPAALLSYALRFTDGTGVRIRERYDPALGLDVDAPAHGRVLIRRSRLRPGVDPDDLRQRILARVPAGLIYDVLITDERDYDDVVSTWVGYAEARDAVRDYDALLEE